MSACVVFASFEKSRTSDMCYVPSGGGLKWRYSGNPSCVFLHDGYITCYFRFLEPQIFVPYSSYSASNYITVFVYKKFYMFVILSSE